MIRRVPGSAWWAMVMVTWMAWTSWWEDGWEATVTLLFAAGAVGLAWWDDTRPEKASDAASQPSSVDEPRA